MRAALFLCSSDELNSYREYSQLWILAARAGWGIAGVFTDDGLDELRRLIARRAVDIVLVWAADHLSLELQNELRAAPCGLYSHQPPAQLPAAESECSTLAGGVNAKRHFLAHQTFRDLNHLDRAIHAAVDDLNKERHSKTCANLRIAASIAREGKRGRPRINSETEQAIQVALAEGKGIRATARACGVGTSVVQRIKAECTSGDC